MIKYTISIAIDCEMHFSRTHTLDEYATRMRIEVKSTNTHTNTNTHIHIGLNVIFFGIVVDK